MRNVRDFRGEGSGGNLPQRMPYRDSGSVVWAPPGMVPWWPDGRDDVTLHHILVRMVAETNRHLGHADLVRELIDGSVGMRQDTTNLPDGEPDWWRGYHDRVEAAAASFAAPRAAGPPD